LQHRAGRAGEAVVVPEEIRVGQDVGGDDLVLQQRVGLQQKRVARVGVDDQLVNAAQVVVVLRFHAVKGFAEAPVAEAGGHAVRAEGVQHVGRADLVAHGKAVQAEAFGLFVNLLQRLRQTSRVRPAHGPRFASDAVPSVYAPGPSPAPRKKRRSTGYTSRLSRTTAVMKRWSSICRNTDKSVPPSCRRPAATSA